MGSDARQRQITRHLPQRHAARGLPAVLQLDLTKKRWAGWTCHRSIAASRLNRAATSANAERYARFETAPLMSRSFKEGRHRGGMQHFTVPIVGFTVESCPCTRDLNDVSQPNIP
jgi:hypothetical protein